MKRTFRLTLILGLAFPGLALADASGSLTIPVNMNFSFDTGTVGSSGGDISFAGSEMTVVGNATIAPLLGQDGVPGILSYLSQNNSPASLGALLPSSFGNKPQISLATGAFFAVNTNGGNLAKLVILSVSATGLQIEWTTYGASATGGTPIPTIQQVANAASYQGSGVAQGSLIVIKGINLSPAGVVQNSFPLPEITSGVSAAFWPTNFDAQGATGVNAPLLYVYNQGGVNQLAAVVPSSLSPGEYELLVESNGVYGPFMPVNVLAAAPGLLTQDTTGNGLALVQNYVSSAELDVNRFTTGWANGATISPAHPGQTLIAWGTGLGPISTPDNVAAPAYNFAANGATIQAFVGGLAISPDYAGRAPGYAAIDQINFTLPGNAPTGCVVPFQIEVNGVLSQASFLSIAPPGAATCVQAGLTSDTLSDLDQGGILTTGNISLDPNFASAGFEAFTGPELAGAVNLLALATPGCVVTSYPAAPGTMLEGLGVPMNTGAITLTGPSGSGISNAPLTPNGLNLSTSGAVGEGQLLPGTYTATGSGGTDVSRFTASMTLPTLVTFGSIPSVVNRSAGLTVTWSGGNPGDMISITGQALLFVPSGDVGSYAGANFSCTTTASAGSFTVPPSILNQLPAVTPAAQQTSTSPLGNLRLSWLTTPNASNGTITAPLTGGGDVAIGRFTGSSGTNASVTYQ